MRNTTSVSPNEFLDPLYRAFENHFRGFRQEVCERLTVYQPFPREAEVTGDRGAILDLGCGRVNGSAFLKRKAWSKCRA